VNVTRDGIEREAPFVVTVVVKKAAASGCEWILSTTTRPVNLGKTSLQRT
jgi:hypothetical protein